MEDFSVNPIMVLLKKDVFILLTGSRDSKMFDMTLMITLLTNIAKLNHYSSFPVVTDTTPAADIERIKYYRNHIAHNNGQIDNSFFNTAWDDVSGVYAHFL